MAADVTISSSKAIVAAAWRPAVPAIIGDAGEHARAARRLVESYPSFSHLLRLEIRAALHRRYFQRRIDGEVCKVIFRPRGRGNPIASDVDLVILLQPFCRNKQSQMTVVSYQNYLMMPVECRKIGDMLLNISPWKRLFILQR
jgi:hypothetical protein